MKRIVVSRYTHVPLAVTSVVLLLGVITWLLVHRGDGLWDPARRLAAPAAPIVTIAPVPLEPASAAEPPGRPAEPSRPARKKAPRAPAPTERFALESGPYVSPEAADHVEDQLNRLGYATVRFRKHDITRVYLVTVTGFPSSDEAKEAVARIGRGSVVEIAGSAEVLVDRLVSLREAVTAARDLLTRGFTVRVGELISPTVMYHIRYGQFGRRADAQASREESARNGIEGRVVKVR